MVQEACAALIDAPVTVMVPEPAAAATAPAPDGQVVVTFGAAATATFAGSASVKLIPDCAGLPAPLASVKVSVDVPPASMTAGANALLSDACAMVSVWWATLLASNPPTVTLPAPLVYALAVLLVTSTVTVQVAPPATLTPLPPTVKVPLPAAAVTVGAPPQLSVTLGAAAITRLAGSVSLNVRPLRAGAPAGFAIVKLSVAACPTPIVTGANALVRDASGCTVRPLAGPGLLMRASALMLPPAFVYGPPTTLDVTSTVTTHEATVAFIAAAVTATTPPPAGAEPNAGPAAT